MSPAGERRSEAGYRARPATRYWAAAIGAGLGYREEEYEAFGIQGKERVPRFLESLEVIKRLWTEEEVTHHGRYFHLTRARMVAGVRAIPELTVLGAEPRRIEEFAGDVAFVRGSEPEQMPHLEAVLNIVVSKAMGRHVEVENTLVSYLREHRFVHGNAQADGRIVLFFYFEDADTGLLMLIPGIRGQMEVARFHLKGGLPDPRWN